MREREVARTIHCFNKSMLEIYVTGSFVLSISIQTVTVPAFRGGNLKGETDT